MALGYLISPAFQYENENGKPLVGGTLRVCHHGTTTPYITYADFQGNRNPEYVPLDAKGMAVLLAEDSRVYDVYCYDSEGVPQWSRLNVSVGGAGGGGGGDYSAGYGIEIEDGVIGVDPAVVQGKLTEGAGIDITDGEIGVRVDGSTITVNVDGELEANVPAQAQADWTEADSSSASYIQNKPEIPPVLSAGTGISIANDTISRRVQFVTTSSSYTYVRSIIDAGDLPVLDKANGSMHDLFVCTMYRGSDIQFIGSAYGQTTLYNLASNNTWTSQILEPQIMAGNAGKILAVNAAGTDAEWRSWVAVPSYAFADRNKVLKVVNDGTSTTLAWGQPSGYTQWETDWASGYSHNHTVTADDVTTGYFDMYHAFASDADTASIIVDPIRVNLVWDTWCTSGLTSNYVSSVDFAIGVDGGSFRDMFTDSAPAHEVHKDWYLYPIYLLHTRCNRIRIRYHLTANATAGTEFQNEVSGLVDQVR